MEKKDNDAVGALLDASNKLNSQIVSVSNCLTLALLHYSSEGLQYTDLKEALGVSDGKLIADLKRFEELGYLRFKDEKFGGKTVTVYTLTSEGHAALKKIKEWMELVIRVSGENNK
jgi:DNA-binding MarR family transcriptional regulator